MVVGLSMATGVIAQDGRPASVAPVVRTVYVMASDQKSSPVLDLAPADFLIKENGKSRDVITAQLSNRPMQIALIIDDNGTGLFRTAVAGFIQRLLGEAVFAVSVVNGQAMKLVDYTADVSRLQSAIHFLGARPATPDGGQLLSAIYEAARELQRREAPRPIIVALTVGGAEHSTMQAHYVLNQLRDSRASLNVFSVAGSSLRAVVPVDRPSVLLETSINIDEVLGDGPALSGGWREEIAPTAGNVRGLRTLAEALSHQYEVSYLLPEGVRPSEKVAVSVKRPGVQLRAPSRIAVR
ncbi:MAG: hypothetical protein ABI051_03755 [Vicinamibacterales bacterium]